MLVQCVQIVLLTEQVIVSRTPLILLVPFENFEYSSSTKLDSFVVDHVQLYPVENQVPIKQVKRLKSLLCINLST